MTMGESVTEEALFGASIAFLEITEAKVGQLSAEQKASFGPRLLRLAQEFRYTDPCERGRVRALSEELADLGQDLKAVLAQNRQDLCLSKKAKKPS